MASKLVARTMHEIFCVFRLITFSQRSLNVLLNETQSYFIIFLPIFYNCKIIFYFKIIKMAVNAFTTVDRNKYSQLNSHSAQVDISLNDSRKAAFCRSSQS